MPVETYAKTLAAAGRVCFEPREIALRDRYLEAALTTIPRILAAVDRNAFGPSYGCCDREYWHYRTAAFPSEMYQEAALPLALVYRHLCPAAIGTATHGLPKPPWQYCGFRRVALMLTARVTTTIRMSGLWERPSSRCRPP